ncbi:MFS transporter [Saccharopolyspora sp. HNM0983]|uniref:MFS transporter n=1 Tax=Saccharopolyspora montiporae TaxID=2781240 RepID=A0A929FYJ7_9PSEU|nr:MFS transporter [Saccharopolyspora sp. HNM0983]MBE9375876.1 MFS transporter [Saccharopolyspora sp. HNM0983]
MGLSYLRELTEYPTGRRRMRILTMAVLASLIVSYEGQIAPAVPLLLDDLDLSLVTYGTISAVGLVAGALAGMLGGRLTDTVGRVRLLVPLLLVTALMCYGMTLVGTAAELLVARAALAVVDGMAVAATAGLVRDFSPRMGRAQAFAFWTWGPVGANFLAAAVAGMTLQLFDNSWRSQFVIMGTISLVVSLVIAANIADLAPQLRARIQQTEQHALTAAQQAGPVRMRVLFQHRVVWAHVVGISVWLVLYLTLSLFGQTMLVQTFGLSAAAASGVMSCFWIVNLATVVLVGRMSDRLQVRKPFAVGGTLLAALLTGVLVVLMGGGGIALWQLVGIGALLGAGMGAAYAPWMANFSENTEDIDPRLQGSAWGVFSFLTRIVAMLVVLALPRVVATSGWSAWLVVALLCLLVFLPMTVLFRGPWRRAAPVGGPAAEREVQS